MLATERKVLARAETVRTVLLLAHLAHSRAVGLLASRRVARKDRLATIALLHAPRMAVAAVHVAAAAAPHRNWQAEPLAGCEHVLVEALEAEGGLALSAPRRVRGRAIWAHLHLRRELAALGASDLVLDPGAAGAELIVATRTLAHSGALIAARGRAALAIEHEDVFAAIFAAGPVALLT